MGKRGDTVVKEKTGLKNSRSARGERATTKINECGTLVKMTPITKKKPRTSYLSVGPRKKKAV